VCLPRVASTSASVYRISCTPELRGRVSTALPHPPTTILVVDDEQMSRRLAYRILTEEGYRVLEADGGSEALEVLRLARGQVDLLIVDVVMHGCDGVELARQVLEQWPDQHVVYMSAHPAEVLMRHGLPSLDVPFLAKPYTRDEALTKVRLALESRRDAHPDAV
jgi:two-component system, cell cycle sensor histidine kinase and response regulator CckA